MLNYEYSPPTHIQNNEYVLTKNFQYLVIHKNANSTIRNYIKANFPNNEIIDTYTPQPHFITWTCLRDPYYRLISGLAYDFTHTDWSIDNITQYLDKISFPELLYTKLSKYFRGTKPSNMGSGYMKHTALQFTYLFNSQIDFYVTQEDLDIFLSMHFPISPEEPDRNMTPYKDPIYELVKEYIESNNKLKEDIQKYLLPDYHVINGLKINGLKWDWQMGKMFKV